MSDAPRPSDERARLGALRRYGILDTPAEVPFDDVVALAAELAEVPIAAITLIDEGRAWFKSRLGLDVAEAPRDVAFCSYAVLTPDEVLQVPDARADERFADNPLVAPDGGLRFYTGAPLVTADGHALGTLCVMDTEPKQLRDSQIAALQRLSRTVMSHLEARRVSHALLSVTEVLDELRGLQHLTELAPAVRLLVELVARVLDADGILAFLAEVPGSSTYRVVDGLAREPGTRVVSELGLDPRLLTYGVNVGHGGSGVAEAALTGQIRFRTSADLDRSLDAGLVSLANAASTVHVPLPGENGYLGVLGLWWSDPVAALEPTALAVLQVLAHEGGHALARIRANQALRVAAETDALTGLSNRRESMSQLAQLPGCCAVGLIDLDNFKLLNDRLGHQAGDEALQRFAGALTEHTRATDLTGRWGGEEFLLALPGATAVDVGQVLARVRASLGDAGPFFSAGLVARAPNESLVDLLGRADAALYRAKSDGRGRDHLDTGHDLDRPLAAT